MTSEVECADLQEAVRSFDHSNIVKKLASLRRLRSRGRFGRTPPVAFATAIFFRVAQTPGEKVTFRVKTIVDRLRESLNSRNL